MRTLNLNRLKENIPTITPTIGAFLAEAAAVALTLNGHKSETILKFRGEEEIDFKIEWTEKTGKDVMKGWADQRETAEYGAIGITVLVLPEVSDYNYFEKANQGNGFDFWVDEQKIVEGKMIRQNKNTRLEVSGILKESKTNSVKKRMVIKKKQVKKGNFTNPALISIVGFGEPIIEISKI